MDVRLERARYGGETEGSTDDGRRFSVPFTIPGELVEIVAPPAQLVRVVEPARSRVAPLCEHFGTCGGCQYQHIDYDAQVPMKTGILLGMFADAGLGPPPPVQTHCGQPYGYRNRIRLRVADVDGTLRLGYSRRASNQFLPIHMCPIAAPVLWRAAEALTRLAADDAVCGRWLRAVSEIEIFTTPDESRLQMSFFLHDPHAARHKHESFAVFCERVKALVPELAGAAAEMDAELGRRLRKSWDGDTWGATGLTYEAAGANYWVSRGGFFQVNRFLVDELVQTVTDGRQGTLAWDLYAGVGLFSRALAGSYENVIAVEGSEIAARDLAALAKTAKTGRIHPVHAPTFEFLRERVVQRERPSLVVMDPPRAGVGIEGCQLLARMKVPEIVYVSCDPLTMTRDLKVLLNGGYEMEQAHLFDLFPQTFHMETVAMLRHAG